VLAELSGEDPLTSSADEDEETLADLVDAVGGHARSLVLLAREVGRVGVRQATHRLHKLMGSLQCRYPNDRQRSLLASVELSLRRLPATVRQQLGPLGGVSGRRHWRGQCARARAELSVGLLVGHHGPPAPARGVPRVPCGQSRSHRWAL